MKNNKILTILCILVFFLNIILPFINQCIDYIFLCNFEILNESINNNGLNIYYALLTPLMIALLYYSLKVKNKYIIIILALKLLFVLTQTGIDAPLYYFFNEVPHMCLNKVILKHIM